MSEQLPEPLVDELEGAAEDAVADGAADEVLFVEALFPLPLEDPAATKEAIAGPGKV